jgi:hypothetical protein
MKTMIIAVSAAALIAAAPAVLAQGVPSKSSPALHHNVSKKHHGGVSRYAPLHEMQAKGSTKGYAGAFGYAPGEPRGYFERNFETLRQVGGGGGGGAM